MMHGPEKSDSAIRAKKPANKAGQPAAEQVEQRAGTEGNTDRTNRDYDRWTQRTASGRQAPLGVVPHTASGS
jgi:hypothetical protein